MANKVVVKNIKTEKYEFTDTEGNYLFSIRFNPADINIIRRYGELTKWFETLNAGDNAGADELIALSDRLKEKIDWFLGVKDASDMCDYMNPFSIMPDGKTYIETALDSVADLITSVMDARTKKANARVAKHTQKYDATMEKS